MYSPGIDTSTLEVVSFDLWLTLIKSNSTPSKATRAKALFDLLGLADVALDEFTKVVEDAEKTADALCEKGEMHYGPRERIELVTEHYGVAALSKTQFVDFYSAQAQRFLNFPPELMRDDTLETLDRLARRYTLACVSNTGFVNGTEMRPALEAIGLLGYFDIQLFSNEIGFNKPDPRIFRELLKRTACTPTEVVHIGDNFIADYNGAEAVGMCAIHVADATMPLSLLLESLL